jgi:hypothetical protein
VAIRPLTHTALAIADGSESFERSAARVTGLAGAPSAAKTVETVQISVEARKAAETREGTLSSGLEGALVDMRVAKYAFIANLKVLQTGADIEEAAAAAMLEPKP